MSPVTMAAVISLGVTLLFTPLVLALLRRNQVIDFPTERSSHTHSVVRGIGIAQVIAIVVTFAALGPIPTSAWIATIGFSLLGFVDDVRRLGVVPRLLIQLGVASWAIIASSVAAWSGILIAVLLGLGATVFLVGFVNSTNFMDGINGISLAHGVLWGLVYLILLQESGQQGWAIVSAAVLGSSMAVLPWNWGVQAKAFLGDAGSYLLGASVGLLALVVLAVTRDPLIALGPLLIYLTDTVVTLCTRAVRKERLLQPHKEHVFQRLAQSTGHQMATSIVVAFSASVSFIAIAMQRNWINVGASYILMLVLISVYLVSPRVVRRSTRST